MDARKIGNRIKIARKEKGWSQEVLAEEAEISAVYVGAIERGTKVPKLAKFIDITNSLGVTSDMLLQDTLVTHSKIRSMDLFEKLKNLPEQDQQDILDVVDILITQANKRK